MTTEMQEAASDPVLEGLHLLHRGKVRDIYVVDDHHLLLVASDRVSAFDVVLPQRLAGKGALLTNLSHFWFDEVAEIRNHFVTCDVDAMPDILAPHRDAIRGRAMLVHRAQPLRAEFVVRGYLAGSAWEEYQQSGSVCGHPLPEGLQQCQKLPEPLLTPTTKAPPGQHDENLTIPALAHMIGAQLASKAGALALALYDHAARMAESRGILLADTKIEFGLHKDRLMLIDELFTPDSSRYWSAATYEPGHDQDSYDKQIIRNALVEAGWNKEPPAPELPQAVLDKALARYQEIEALITKEHSL